MSAPQGLLLSDDLIFSSRIGGAARARGLALVVARSAAEFVDLARRLAPRCVIIDLDCPGLDLRTLVDELSQINPRPRVVAYGPHVNAALLHEARLAGCNPVLARSKFVEQIESEMAGWFA
jgi:ActR/RegA family two-component response regulator